MKGSARAKRMAKHRNRLNKIPKLNLVPLIDCFTLLIFFLLINYSTAGEALHAEKTIKLPASISDTLPGETVVVMVNATDVLIGGRSLGKIADMMASPAKSFAPLEAELKYLATKAVPLTPEQQKEGRPITIMGDHKIPYEQLKKIMATCVSADYRNVALAVLQKEASNKLATEE